LRKVIADSVRCIFFAVEEIDMVFHRAPRASTEKASGRAWALHRPGQECGIEEVLFF
jgi:hypothetical protein